MRFLPDGPSIPDELLESRDQGDVIFLCGAGISQPAGLPGFSKLARLVVDKLGTPSDAASRVLLDQIQKPPIPAGSLDQVFQYLRYEYGSEYIDEVVGGLLKPAADANTEPHSVILRLSRSAGHHPQIVTTNFDLLFERVDPSLRTHVAPVLPDLRNGQPLDGIVYLHGRLNGPATSQPHSPLILSSADFGRAYLAQGWATKFMAHLLRHQTIVLLGYSATDPPVRYLLEGIHSLGEEKPAQIYAFDRGPTNAVEARWRDRGVRALAYDGADPQHAALWDTLHAWADRADDVEAWRRSIVDLAARRPTELAPYQRGQVCSLIRTDAGAKLFHDSPTAPPAEWLCVFDYNLRYGKPSQPVHEEEKFDPLDHYGLDDDPPRSSIPERPKGFPAADFISSLVQEEDLGEGIRLAGWREHHLKPLTSRLFHLAHWLVRLLNDPILVWWAARYESLHPRLASLIEWKLEKPDEKLHPHAYRLWLILQEKWQQVPHDHFGEPWFPFLRLQKRDGWAPHVLRQFERILRPYFSVARPAAGPPAPPSGPWDSLRLRDVADLDVKFLERDAGALAISTETLPAVFRILRRGLEQAEGMLSEIELDYWRTATFIPKEAAQERYLDEFDKHLFWVVRLFDRLAEEHPDLARDELKHWPQGRFVFDKFRLYALHNPTLISGADAAAAMLRLSDTALWNFDHRRELLHALASRWGDLDEASRERLESRLITGPARDGDEQDVEHQRRRTAMVSRTLGWLEWRGCALSARASATLAELRAAEPRWQPSWDQQADAVAESHFRTVQVDTDPARLLDAPISEIIARAREHGTREMGLPIEQDPFRGLVERRPRRAFVALAYAARRKDYPAEFWRTLLQSWPDNTFPRLCWTLAQRLVRLPTATVTEAIHAASEWFRKHLPTLAKSDLNRALSLWDALLKHLVSGGEKAQESTEGDTFSGGKPQHRSRRTYSHAINSPVGRLTETLRNILADFKLAVGAGIPAPIRTRFEKLLSAPGEVRDYSLSEMTSCLNGLHSLDPQWTEEHLLPRLDPLDADAEPAWSGYTFDHSLASPALFARLKPHLLGVFRHLAEWRWDDDPLRHWTEVLIQYCYWHHNGGGYVSDAEARVVLQQSAALSRSHGAWRLVRLVKEQKAWQSFGKPFMENVWPRERSLQTSATSRHLAELAQAADDEFPDAVKTVLPLLVPLEHADTFLHEAPEDVTEPKLYQRFPESYLALLNRLIAADARSSPHGLAAIIRALVEALPRLRQDPRWRRLNELVMRG
jgi:NAD-dependent SIR2 family protein deacetylase